jgi:hypothetical protein
MNTHIFERACPLYQEGALTPIFEGDMPPLKKDPKPCPVNGTVTGKLLRIAHYIGAGLFFAGTGLYSVLHLYLLWTQK